MVATILLTILFQCLIIASTLDKKIHFLFLKEIEREQAEGFSSIKVFSNMPLAVLFLLTDLVVFYFISKNPGLDNTQVLLLVASTSILAMIGASDWRLRLIPDRYIISLFLASWFLLLAQTSQDYRFEVLIYTGVFYLISIFCLPYVFAFFDHFVKSIGFADIKVLWAASPLFIPFFMEAEFLTESSVLIDPFLFLMLVFLFGIIFMIVNDKNHQATNDEINYLKGAPLCTSASIAYPVTMVFSFIL